MSTSAVVSPVDAVFIYPYEVSELQCYGLRSGYVDFKANLKQNAGAAIWAERIEEVYGLKQGIEAKDFASVAAQHFRSLSLEDLKSLHAKGVSHIFTYGDIVYDTLPWLAGNQEWAIYHLDFSTTTHPTDTTAPLP